MIRKNLDKLKVLVEEAELWVQKTPLPEQPIQRKVNTWCKVIPYTEHYNMDIIALVKYMVEGYKEFIGL